MSESKLPPKLAGKLLSLFLKQELSEEVLGDLQEKFDNTLSKRSLIKAKLDYWLQVLNYLRPFAIRKLKFINHNGAGMLKNYATVGWRNLARNKSNAVINIGGLALGMTVAMLIGLWIYDELTFNQYHDNHARVARVMRNGTMNGETFTTTYQPAALGEELKEKYGDNFKHVILSMGFEEHIISVNELSISSKGQFIQYDGVEMLSLDMVSGSQIALKEPQAVVIAESLSKSLFGDKEAIGKSVRIDNTMDARIAGVYKDIPKNSNFAESKFFGSWELFLTQNEWIKYQRFSNNFLDIYVELEPSVAIDHVNDVIKDAILNNIADQPDYVAVHPQIFLHPMDDWHLRDDFKNGKNNGGLIQFVWLFAIVGSFVLLLACINFMNLSTARSEKRGREVGIRKAMGSARTQLIQQFFSEAFIVVGISFLLSLLTVILTLGWFNDFAGKDIQMPWTNGYFWIASVAFAVVTALLAGSYPAIYLSSFQPVKVLKGVFRGGRFAGMSRKSLVVLQFTVSVTLVIGTIVVYQQIQFARIRPLGYDGNGLVMVKMSSPEFAQKFDVLRNELKNTGNVEDVARSGGRITTVWGSQGGFSWQGKDPGQQVEFATLSVGPQYGATVGWNFKAGRDFSAEMSTDSSSIVITESAARLMDMKDAVGQNVHWEPGWRKPGDFKVIGVIDDLVMESPFADTKPTIFYIMGYNDGIMNIRLSPNTTAREGITSIDAVFHKIIPNVAVDYKFVDTEYATKFAAEERIGKLSSVFATLAILISCLGLIGLSSFLAEQRMKEIGIRKVLGASVINVWVLLSKDFVILILIATAIAVPSASYALGNWLSQYAYRLKIPIWTYVVATTGALVITMLTISYHTLRAAYINPAKTLKSE